MGDFFKPWRRRIGVVTLLMARVMCFIWIRSFNIVDIFAFGKIKSSWSIRSYNGSVGWHDDISGIFYGDVSRSSTHFEYTNAARWHQWSFEMFRLHRKEEIQFSGESNAEFQVPDWSLVIPLTLLTAYLLLTKPRIAIPKTIAEDGNPK